MLGALIGFELRRRLKLLSTYVYGGVLFGAGLFLMLANAGLFKSFSAAGGSERVHANGPYSVFANLNVVALLGLFTVAAIFGQAASQDFTTGTWPLIFTRNVGRARYLLGRFFGAWLFSAALYLAIGAGQLFGALVAQLIDPSQLGPHRLDVYLWPYVVGVWPMLFVSGVVFFSLAALTRAMAPVYVGVVVLVLGYLVASSVLSDLQHQSAAALLDPFGFVAFDAVTRYWTPLERNDALLPLTGLFLGNRLLWLTLGALGLAVTIARFRTGQEEQRGQGTLHDAPPKADALVPTLAPTSPGWRTALSGGWLHFRDVTRSPVYWSFVGAGLLFVLLGVVVAKELFGTATLPVTWQVLELASGTFQLFVLITLTFYAGELVWKERDAGLADILDASRVPTWVPFAAKGLALFLVAASLQLVVGAAALTAQLAGRFFDIEWRLYAMELIVFGVLQDVLLAVLALVVQVLVNQKYLGHGVMVLYFVSQLGLRALGLEERLLRYGSEPPIAYSDMNGYGHWLAASLVWRAYWAAVAVGLLAVAFLFVSRGRERPWRERVALARSRVTRPWLALVGTAAVVALSVGGFLFHATHVQHPYRTAKDVERARAEYEKTWKDWLDKPTPRITDVEVALDVFPDASPPRLVARGTYRLENKTDAAIDEVLVGYDETAIITSLAVGGNAAPSRVDEAQGVRVYRLQPALEPGATTTLDFDFTFESHALVHGTRRTDVVNNGTFFNNQGLPSLGYQPAFELSSDGDRKSYGLSPKARMADRDDPVGRERNYIRRDSDFIGFGATVSTSVDQVAVAPGTLVKEWTEGERRFFRYEMDQPILHFYSVLSARYAVRRDAWEGVTLEVFHEPKHPYNVDRMLAGMKDALAYCSEAFGPYQHRQARILEFPRYQQFAQSFPNTIPYSEGVGFIARVREDEPSDIDYPYYVTAHEIAHQWWAHQVVGGDVQGATMTSETMAQYSALMVMKRRFGPEKMRRFLKYELDRYLVGRVMERKQELPLSRVENQTYIHYQKGSLAMYWLQDLVGEDVVNRALRRYVEAVRFKGPPYTNSTELISFLREEVPAEHHGVLDDLFEHITLYDNRALSASTRQAPGGGWDVTVTVKAVKYRVDEKGVQAEVPFDDVMDVGAIDAAGAALFVEKVRLTQGERTLSFTAPVKPARVGIDPLNKLIDRTSDDNTVAPSVE